jgi:hypothetical protein
MANLTDLGFSKDVIAETIVTSYDENFRPNAAPMGSRMESEKQIMITLFDTSSTLKNLRSNLCAVINVTSNAEMFYRTALKETSPEGKLPQNWFEKATKINAPQLRMADATVEISVSELKPISCQKTQALCDVKHVEAKNTPPKAYCRALSATIEAIIHATRIKVFAEKRIEQEKLNRLRTLVDDCNDIVNRTAPNSNYAQIMTDLNKQISLWSK